MKKKLKKIVQPNRKNRVRNTKKTHLLLATFYALQAGVILALGISSYYPITVSYLAKDPLLSMDGKSILSSASRTIFDVNIVYILLTLLLFGVIYHLLIATILKKRYESSIKKEINQYYWVDTAVSGSLIMVGLCLLLGIYDFASILMIVILMFFMSAMGFLTESLKSSQKLFNRPIYYLGCISLSVVWVVLAISIWNTAVIGGGKIDGFVYLSALSVLFLACLQQSFLYLATKRQGKWSEYSYIERKDLLLSVITKVLIVWIVIVGIR